MLPERTTVTVTDEKSVARCLGSGCGALSSRATACRPPRILARDQFGQKRLIRCEICEVGVAAQFKRFLDRLFEMAVRRFDRTVLVGDAVVVARRRHAVMLAEIGIAFGRVVVGGSRRRFEIAVGGRQPVGAMLARDAAELP